eukprot:95061-Prorocentrum_minimum.AAC.1
MDQSYAGIAGIFSRWTNRTGGTTGGAVPQRGGAELRLRPGAAGGAGGGGLAPLGGGAHAGGPVPAGRHAGGGAGALSGAVHGEHRE